MRPNIASNIESPLSQNHWSFGGNMKYCTVTLVILAAVFICQNEASVSPVLNHFNETVHRSQDALQLRKGHIAEEGNKKFESFLTNLKEDVANSVNKTRGEFEGKGAACVATLENELNNAKNKVTPEMEKCVQQHTPKWESIENNINGLIARGNQIEARINEIEAECASDNVSATRVCIATRIPKVAITVGIYLGAVGKEKGQTHAIIALGFVSSGKCIHPLMKEFHVKIVKAKENALACTERVQEI